MIQLRHFGRKIWNFITILLELHQGVQIGRKVLEQFYLKSSTNHQLLPYH